MGWVLDDRQVRMFDKARKAHTEHVFLARCATRLTRRAHVLIHEPGKRAFPHASASGIRLRYPWGDWTDGQWWLLVERLDYQVHQDAFVAGLHGRALRDGTRAEVCRSRGCLAVRFR